MAKFFMPKLSKRQWATALVIAFADFCSAVCISLQAPFYPAEVSIFKRFPLIAMLCI
jgi:hypothetical protein